MRKGILAAFCMLTIMASTVPVFAADTTTTTTTVTLTDAQLSKLTAIQTKLSDLVAKIESLKTTYKSTKKTKGLLNALDQFEKQAKNLKTAITNYKKNPKANANKKIKSFQYRTYSLTWKVAVKEKLLKKVTAKKTTDIVPVKKPTTPTTPIKNPITPIKDPTKCTA
jgi:chromosome segregation ATPase